MPFISESTGRMKALHNVSPGVFVTIANDTSIDAIEMCIAVVVDERLPRDILSV